jgi:tRNA pseudouridine55 synthase
MLVVKEINEDPGTVLLVNKPLTWTSFDVTHKIKRFLIRRWHKQLPTAEAKKKKVKVGHAGTLDPLATGLLIICVGKETKNIEKYMGMPKTYTGTFVLGATTPSYDKETAVDHSFAWEHLKAEELQAAAKGLTGMISQVPPAFSAIQVNGQRAYMAARQGEELKLEPRQVEVFKFEITEIAMPIVHFEIVCSKGTYIRALARDFGKVLNNGAYLGSLCRTQIGDFKLSDAWQLEEIATYFDEPLKFSDRDK